MTHQAEASVLVQAPPEAVWAALTDPALVREYLFGTEMSTDWRVGSPIAYRGEWEGKAYEDSGTVLEVDRPRRLVTSYFSPGSGLPDVPENHQRVTYELVPDGAATRLTVRQDNNADDAGAEHAAANWRVVLDGLKSVVERA